MATKLVVRYCAFLLLCGCVLLRGGYFVGALAGLPGGGTSLAFQSDSSVAYILNFTALAGATNYSMEAWAYSRSSNGMPSILTFATSDDPEYWTVALGSKVYLSLDGSREWQELEGPEVVGWRHIAVAAADGDVRGYID
eukprot:RCo010358